MFAKILVPIDGSPTSYRGLRFAVDIAKKYEAEVTLMHVIEQPIYAYSSPSGIMLPADYFTGMKNQAEGLLAKRRKELKSKGVRVKTLLKRGSPSVQIVRASSGFDLVVMGSRGFGRFKSLVLGSVSNSVVQQSRVPVLLIRPR